MRVIATWPDPRDPKRIIDQSRDCGGGPMGDADPFVVNQAGARTATPVAHSMEPVPGGMYTALVQSATGSNFNGRKVSK